MPWKITLLIAAAIAISYFDRQTLPVAIAAIQRALLQLEQQGGKAFFGEPALRLEDMMRTSLDGRGQVNVLDATRLMNSPRLYAAFLLWLLSELFEQLPEVGDLDKPKLVFIFDEAHLLFDDAPKALLGRIDLPYMSARNTTYLSPAARAALATVSSFTPIQLGTASSPGRGVVTESS